MTTTTIEPTEEQQDAAQMFCSEHVLRVDDALARLLAEREAGLRESLRLVEDDRATLAGFRDAVCATARSVAPDVDGGPVAVLHKLRDTSSMLEAHARDSRAEVKRLHALNESTEQALSAAHEERDALRAKLAEVEASLHEGSKLFERLDEARSEGYKCAEEAEARAEKAEAEVAALKAKLAEVEAERDAARTVITDGAPPIPWTMPLDRSQMSATLDCGHAHLEPGGRVEVRCMRTNHILARIDVHPHDGEEPGKLQHMHLCQQEIAAALLWSHRRSHHVIALSPAGAGTEWAAPLAAVSKPARDPVLPTVRAATSPLDWQDDEKGGAK